MIKCSKIWPKGSNESDGVRYDQMWSKDVSGSLGSRVLYCEGLVGIPRRIRTARDIKNFLERGGGFISPNGCIHFGYFLVQPNVVTSASPGV